MDRWKRIVDWCQQPSKIKIRTFNPRNVVVLVTLSIILASSITFGAWSYQVAIAPSPAITKYNYETLFPTLIITTDTTLTEDYFGHISIEADGVTLDGNGHTVTGNGFWMWNSTQRMWDVSWGITVKGRTRVTVKNCHVTNFFTGFWLDGSDGNTLLNNTANNNVMGTGFQLSYSSSNTILNNTANNNINGTGFAVGMSFGNTFKGNVAYDNDGGFVVEMSFGNTFKGNVAYDNDRGFQITGFNMEMESFEEHWGFIPEENEGNIFEANTAKGNTEFGFLVMGDIYSNIFFHNNLVDNAVQAALAPAYYPDEMGQGYPVWGVSTWDDGYPSGGNYWSDYEGVDADGDGIGDTPYHMPTVTYEFDEEGIKDPVPIIGEPDGNNVDRYPLMAPING